MRIILAAAMVVSIGVARAQCPTCNDLALHPQTGAVTIGPAIERQHKHNLWRQATSLHCR